MLAWLVYEKQPALCFPNVQAAFLCFQTALSEERLPENGVSAKQKRSFDGVKTDLCFAFPAAARIHAGFFRQALDFGRLIGGQYQRGGIVDDVHNLPCVAVDG